MDMCNTPPYPLESLIPYLDGRIRETACGKHNYLGKALELVGYSVTATDIQDGVNFFDIKSLESDEIQVTNPPYGIKYQWVEHSFKLQRPFALLLPVEARAMFGSLVRKYGDIEILYLHPRVDFDMPNEGLWSSAQFPVAWFCWQLLPKLAMDAEMHKPKRTQVRWVLKRDKITGELKPIRQTGYCRSIMTPVAWDKHRQKFIYSDT